MHPSLRAPTPYPNCIASATVTDTCCWGHWPALQRAVTNAQPFRVEVKAPNRKHHLHLRLTGTPSFPADAALPVVAFWVFSSVPVNSLKTLKWPTTGVQISSGFSSRVCVCKFSKEVLTLRIIYFCTVKKEGSNFKGQYCHPFIICTPDYSCQTFH